MDVYSSRRVAPRGNAAAEDAPYDESLAAPSCNFPSPELPLPKTPCLKLPLGTAVRLRTAAGRTPGPVCCCAALPCIVTITAWAGSSPAQR